MDCYREMYYKLFNKVTDVIDELKKVQQETEEMIISYSAEKPDNILHIPRKGEGDDPDKKPPKE